MTQTLKEQLLVGVDKRLIKYEEKRWFGFRYLVKVKSESIGKEIVIYGGDEPITQIYFNGKKLLKD